MPSPTGRRDAAATRAALLSAATDAFARYGYEGARVDAIAASAGYNKSLLFQHFGDKLGLYSAVLAQSAQATRDLQDRIVAPLLADPSIASDGERLRELLTEAFGTVFDYFIAHPHTLRIVTWELASGWQTVASLPDAPTLPTDGAVDDLFAAAQRAGLFRSTAPAALQFALALQLCQTCLASAPLYAHVIPGVDLQDAHAFAAYRAMAIQFIVSGLIHDRPIPEEMR